MIPLVASLWSAVTSRRDWLTLLIVAGVAAWLYVSYERVRRDRDRAMASIVTLCASAGATALGKSCLDRVGQLARFEREALAASNRALADHQADQIARARRDAAAAADDAASARAARQSMEEQDGKVSRDRVDGPWFDALNRLAGLREPSAGPAGPDRDPAR